MKQSSNRLATKLLESVGKAMAGIVCLQENGVLPPQADAAIGAFWPVQAEVEYVVRLQESREA